MSDETQAALDVADRVHTLAEDLIVDLAAGHLDLADQDSRELFTKAFVLRKGVLAAVAASRAQRDSGDGP